LERIDQFLTHTKDTLCGVCKNNRPAIEFVIMRGSKWRISSRCIGCDYKIRAKNQLKYVANNREDVYKRQNMQAAERRKNDPKVRAKNNDYVKTRHKNDPVYRLRRIVNTAIYNMIRRDKGGHSVMEFLPYTIEQLKTHLESMFEPWMTWQNHGTYRRESWNDADQSTWAWQIDHITPQSETPYTSMSDANFKKAWDLKNLRPLSAISNQLDGARRTRHKKT
jgi:hypothetical protein